MAAKIKICGITNLADAKLAIELGADLLGLNFYPPSPRYIEPPKAAEIIASLAPNAAVMAGVFVNATAEAIQDVLAKCPLDIAQLHGTETNDQCQRVRQLGVDVIKALRIRQPVDIEKTNDYDVQTILLDAFREELYGGTGHRFDWGWIKQGDPDRKVFLAGGITPANIAEALAVGTYGVDLCSGVEKEPAIKDKTKMIELFEEIARYYEGDCS